MNTRHRLECIEITDIVRTTDRCVIARAKATGKLINLPRSISQFCPGMAIVPDWFARKVREKTGHRCACTSTVNNRKRSNLA